MPFNFLKRFQNTYQSFKQAPLTKETNLEKLLSHIPIASIITDCDPKLTIKNANSEFCKLFSYSSVEEIIGQPSSILNPVSGRDNRIINSIYQKVSNGQTWEGRITNSDSLGNPIPIRLSAFPIYHKEEEKPSKIYATFIDLREIERDTALTLVGRMTSGFAHDLNNYFTSILGYVEILKKSKNTEESAAALDILSKTTNKAINVCQKILNVRPGTINPEKKNVEQIVREYINTSTLKEELSEQGIVLDTNYNSHNYSLIDPTHIEMVVENLVKNAKEAIPESKIGKLVSVSVYDQFCNQTITDHLGNRVNLHGDYVVLEVQDTGSGIANENLSKVWNHFYTSKKTRGHGIGMAIIENSIAMHKGAYICVNSKLDQGTKFTIYFEATPATDTKIKTIGAESSGSIETI